GAAVSGVDEHQAVGRFDEQRREPTGQPSVVVEVGTDEGTLYRVVVAAEHESGGDGALSVNEDVTRDPTRVEGLRHRLTVPVASVCAPGASGADSVPPVQTGASSRPGSSHESHSRMLP